MLFKKSIEREVAREFPHKTIEEIKAEVKSHHESIGRAIAQRFSRGNVNIKMGQFLTREDLDARRARRQK